MWSFVALLALGAEPDELWKQGMQAQKAKDATTAKAKYELCLKLDPEHVGCHWELGWTLWTQSDWPGVVSHWETVKRLKPDHSEVDTHLSTAKGHLASLKAIREAGATAPDAVRPRVAEGKTLTLRAVGDIMLGTTFPAGYLPENDGADMLTGVSDWLSNAPLTFANLEGPLCDDGKTTKCGSGGNCYAFRSPTRYGKLLKAAGIDVVSTANNHAEDFGVHCREVTEKTLDALDIAHSGRPGDVASMTVDGFKVAVIGFHSSRNSHYINDHVMAKKLVAALDETHDIVIVSFHGGAEGTRALHVPDKMEVFYGEQRGHLRVFAREVISAGADLVIGHGPHVPRAMEVVDGKLVAYSLGNFATYGRFNLSGHLSTGLVLEATLDNEGNLVSGKILPVRQIGDGVPTKDAENTAVDLIRSLSEKDCPKTAPVIAKDGSFAPRP